MAKWVCFSLASPFPMLNYHKPPVPESQTSVCKPILRKWAQYNGMIWKEAESNCSVVTETEHSMHRIIYLIGQLTRRHSGSPVSLCCMAALIAFP